MVNKAPQFGPDLFFSSAFNPDGTRADILGQSVPGVHCVEADRHTRPEGEMTSLRKILMKTNASVGSTVVLFSSAPLVLCQWKAEEEPKSHNLRFSRRMTWLRDPRGWGRGALAMGSSQRRVFMIWWQQGMRGKDAGGKCKAKGSVEKDTRGWGSGPSPESNPEWGPLGGWAESTPLSFTQRNSFSGRTKHCSSSG